MYLGFINYLLVLLIAPFICSCGRESPWAPVKEAGAGVAADPSNQEGLGKVDEEPIIDGRVPRSLFGIDLRKVYEIGDPDNGNYGDLPIAKFAGVWVPPRGGINYYYKPLRESSYFPYKEDRASKSEKFYSTNYRLNLVPVYDDKITNLGQLHAGKGRCEVLIISWEDKKSTAKDAYYWARDMASVFKSTLSAVKPVDENDNLRDTLEVRFIDSDRKLVIGNREDSVYFTLSVDDEYFLRRTKEAEDFVNRIRAKDILK